GVSGMSQTISLASLLIFGSSVEPYRDVIYSVFYIAINIPIVILAFRKIGVRFAILTLVNVALVSIFASTFRFIPFLNDLGQFVHEHGGMLSRALFAGICTGLSSAIAFKFELSAGGADVIAYYVSLKKSTQTGKYTMAINTVIIVIYGLLMAVSPSLISAENDAWIMAAAGVLFSIVYLFTTMLVIDFINVRNKKVQIQIVTKKENLHTMLLANVPHGATIIKGTGAFSGEPRFIINIVVSSYETKKVVNLVRQIDSESFINVSNLQQVYGRFFIRPVK
ncbi:MAG: YitT family protein, partial [Bacilli bacterium]|nr:YitT family protein [Bacilli bacterium]